MPSRPLRDVLTLARDAVPLVADDAYRTVGLLNYGRGLFERPIIRGADTSYKTYYRIRAGQFVYSRLFAWEGALAVVPTELDGRFVSQEFPTFDIDTTVVLPEYLSLVCQWPNFWSAVSQMESGMGGRRKRVHPDRLLFVEIPIAELSEQAAAVELFTAVDDLLKKQAASTAAAAQLARALRHDHFSDAIGNSSSAAEAFEVTMGRQRAPRFAAGENMIPYLRAANVKEGRLDLRDVKEMNFEPLEQMKYTLRSGDTLITEGCGSLSQVGACAQWNGELSDPVAFQNTLIRLRGREGLTTSGYAHQWARYAFEAGVFEGIATGTNIYHLGSTRLGGLTVTLIPLEDQDEFVHRVDAADEVVTHGTQAIERLRNVRTAVLTDILGRASDDIDEGSGQHAVSG